MVSELREMDYEDRLKAMDLQSLYYRRDRGDMIECYKMTNGKYDIPPLLKLDPDTSRRGHLLKLKVQSSKKEVQPQLFLSSSNFKMELATRISYQCSVT